MPVANAIAMALIAVVAVVAAFAARHAESAERSLIWMDGLAQPVREISINRRRDGFVEEAAKFAGVDGAIGVLRRPGAALPATRTLVVRDPAAFQREVDRRFQRPGGAPLALTPDGRLRAGYVTRVEIAGRRCDFAIAGYADGGPEIVAVARAVVCEPADPLTPPDVRLAGLLAAESVER